MNRLLTAIITLTLLTACGGGGAGSGSPSLRGGGPDTCKHRHQDFHPDTIHCQDADGNWWSFSGDTGQWVEIEFHSGHPVTCVRTEDRDPSDDQYTCEDTDGTRWLVRELPGGFMEATRL